MLTFELKLKEKLKLYIKTNSNRIGTKQGDVGIFLKQIIQLYNTGDWCKLHNSFK